MALLAKIPSKKLVGSARTHLFSSFSASQLYSAKKINYASEQLSTEQPNNARKTSFEFIDPTFVPRKLPDSAAYFTGNAKLYDLNAGLDKLIEANKDNMHRVKWRNDKSRYWIKQESLEAKFGHSLKRKQYLDIITKVAEVSRIIHNGSNRDELMKLILYFRDSKSKLKSKLSPKSKSKPAQSILESLGLQESKNSPQGQHAEQQVPQPIPCQSTLNASSPSPTVKPDILPGAQLAQTPETTSQQTNLEASTLSSAVESNSLSDVQVAQTTEPTAPAATLKTSNAPQDSVAPQKTKSAVEKGAKQGPEIAQDIAGTNPVKLWTVTSHRKKRKNSQIGYKDRLGRFFAIGRRKSSRACAWVVPVKLKKITPNFGEVGLADEITQSLEKNSRVQVAQPSEVDGHLVGSQPPTNFEYIVENPGDIFVNGKPLAEYFSWEYDCESVIFPLRIAKAIGHYNIWLTVTGGGHTGQAEAVSLALARAIAVSNELNEQRLKEANCLVADSRRVERKKTGQPKARKKFTWVKR